MNIKPYLIIFNTINDKILLFFGFFSCIFTAKFVNDSLMKSLLSKKPREGIEDGSRKKRKREQRII